MAMRATRVVQRLDITPKVAFISYANFSSRADTDQAKLRRAYKILRQLQPELTVFPPVQVDVALEPERFRALFGDRIPDSEANVLIFPDLGSANASSKLLSELGGADLIGPVLLGTAHPFHVIHRESSVEQIVNLVSLAAVDALARR